MAVTVDIRSAGAKTAGATSLDMTHTVSSGLTNSILVADPTTGSPSTVGVSTVFWDPAGVNEPLAFRNDVSDANCNALVWDKVNPTPGSGKILRVNPASTCEITVSAASYQFVNQATPWRGSTWPTANNTPSSGSPQPSVTVTTVAGDMVHGCVFSNENSSDDTFTATGGATLVGSQNVGAGKHSGGAADLLAAGTSTVLSLSGVGDTNHWGIVAGALAWDGTGGAGSNPLVEDERSRPPSFDEDWLVTAFR